MTQRVQLANTSTTRAGYLTLAAENNNSCASCGSRLSNIVSSRIYLHNHFDRADGALHDYLCCRKICYEDMVEFTKEIDFDYDRMLEPLDV